MSGVAPDDGIGRRSSFRPDIEGLRAVAVLLVLIYHAQLPWFGGGFIGVDVFFVVSGFLITGLIVRELQETGSVNLPAFYARRARRLLPAAALVILVTVAVSIVVLPPLRLPDLAIDGAAAALYVPNIRFAIQATDYLQADFDPSPLLHYWSLGVEEQFYLFWPALLLLTTRLAGVKRWTGAIVAVVAIGGVTSLVLSLVLTQVDAPLAFFLLPARAWELALGALVFLAARRLSAIPRSLAVLASAAGLALIVGAGAVINVATPFPGVAALFPTVGTALVILGGFHVPLVGPSRLLATAPARWLGRISYSLYLWHWPVLVLPAAVAGEALPMPVRVGLAAATIPIAALSQRFVEEPIRHGLLTGLRTGRSLALAGVASLVVAMTSVAVGQATGLPGAGLGGEVAGPTPDLVLPVASPGDGASPTPRSSGRKPKPTPSASLPPTANGSVPDDVIPPLLKVRTDVPPIYRDNCHLSATEVSSGECAYGVVDSPVTVVLFGDSHAAQWFPALERIALERRWRLLSLTKGSCPAADISVWSPSQKRLYTECDEWRASVLERIARERPALVVISSSRIAGLMISQTETVASQSHDELWGPAVQRMLEKLKPISGEVVLMGDTPNPKGDPSVCLSAHLDDMLACATAAKIATLPRRAATEARVSEEAGTTFIDPTPWICPSDPCPVIIDRFLVYRNGGHIATAFARGLAPYVAEQLPDIP